MTAEEVAGAVGGPVGAAGGGGPVAGGPGPGPADGPVAAPVRPVVAPGEACVLPHGAEPRRRYLGLLCGRHFHELSDRLREVELLFALRDELLLPGPSGQTRHGTSFGSPAPGRIELMAVTDARGAASMGQVDVPGMLAAWVRLVVEERGIDVVVTGLVSQSVRLLRRERKWIAGQEWVGDYAAELRDVHRALATASGASMWPEAVGRCPNCQSKLFNDMTGADVVTCRKCGSSWSGVAWLRLRLIFEQEQEGKR